MARLSSSDQIHIDNGHEYTAMVLAEWAEEHNAKLEFIKLGKPTRNGYVEQFNRSYRTEILDYYLFSDLDEVRDIASRWMREYNEERPYELLGDLTPSEYRDQVTSLEEL